MKISNAPLVQKEKAGGCPPKRFNFCWFLGFHHYYLKVIKQLIARLIHRNSMNCTSFEKFSVFSEEDFIREFEYENDIYIYPEKIN